MSPLSFDVFDTMFRKAVVVNSDVVLVRITHLLEGSKCFFAIATDNNPHGAVLEAIFLARTFAPGHSTPVGHNGSEIGMTQWLALSATGRAIDPGVSKPPSAAAPTAAPIWQMLMSDNVKAISRNKALEAENARLKGERSKPKRQVARDRYRLSREEKKLHEQVHSSLVEGRAPADELAAAKARLLSETIKTTNDALEEARKGLKELEDRLASTHTIPGRNINFDNPSRWTIEKDVDNLAQFFTARFGDDWTKSSATEEEGTESTVNEGKAAYPSKVLGAFLKKHLPRSEMKRLLPPAALRKIKKDIADCITEYFDEISVDLFLHTEVSTRGYQTILNLLSFKQRAEGLVMAVLPYGTKFPKLRST
jgi:hypothetical protein